MKYLVNRETKEHVVCRDEFCIRSDRWTLVEADSEGWIPHTRGESPLPSYCMVEVKVFNGTVSKDEASAYAWNKFDINGKERAVYISHYRPILEPVQEPDYDPRSVSFNLLDRLKAAHEHAQQIPDLEAELREVLTGMGYDLVARSPFVDAEFDPWKPAQFEYDRQVHSNPDAKEWADFFMQTFPQCAADHGTMISWFANAMMAMHDHIKNSPFVEPVAAAEPDMSDWRNWRFGPGAASFVISVGAQGFVGRDGCLAFERSDGGNAFVRSDHEDRWFLDVCAMLNFE